jgi:hypothetical protein
MRRLAPALLVLAAFLAVPALVPDVAAGRGERAAALARKLQTQRIAKATFKEVPLPEFLKWLRLATGHNFLFDVKTLKKEGIEPKEITFTADLEDVTVATLLDLALSPHQLAAVAKDDLVMVTTHAASLGKPITRLYGISHITYTKIDFIAPDINLHPSDFTPVDDYEPERVVENDPLDSGEAVADLLRQLVAPDEWDNEGWRITATDRYLVVRAPRAVQAKVLRALDQIAAMK